MTTSRLSKTSRLFWKCIYPFLNHRSTIARAIYARRIKRQMPYAQLQKAIWHILTVFEHFDANINTLFLGSSHTVYGIAPKNFKVLRAWNAGFNFGDAKLAYYTYQTLRKQWPKAPQQIVVMSDDFWIVSHQTEFTSDFYHAILVKHFTQMPYETDFLMTVHDNFLKHTLETRTVPNETLFEKGFIPEIPVSSNANTPSGVTSRVLGHIKRAFFEPTQLHYLVALKEAVEADGRQLVFLRFPVREDYLKILDAYPKNVWEPTASIREGCPLIDCFRMPFPPEAWNDTDHFSEVGARQFTRAIEAQLLNLISQNKHAILHTR